MKSVSSLTWLCKTKSSHYAVSKIPKRRGGFRDIHAPDKVMRLAQSRILTRILNQVETPEYTWAFEQGRSVPEMAVIHQNKPYVISLDIKNFFPSVTQKMIQDMLSSENIADGAAARSISELCTYKWFLPQGGITSPKISNLVVKNTFGPEVKKFCDDILMDVTIYADDITISPKGGVDRSDNVTISNVIISICDMVKRHGFIINAPKTKVMKRGARQTVCGVVVNEHTNLPQKERKRLRAIVHNICTNGVEAEARKFDPDATEELFLNHIKGKLNWYRMLNPELGNRLYVQLTTYLAEVSGAVSRQETEVA